MHGDVGREIGHERVEEVSHLYTTTEISDEHHERSQSFVLQQRSVTNIMGEVSHCATTEISDEHHSISLPFVLQQRSVMNTMEEVSHLDHNQDQ